MKIQSSPALIALPPRASTHPTAAPSPDTLSIGSGELEKAPIIEMVAGTTGVVGATLGLYAGSLGGSLMGASLGGGVGLILGAMAHSSPLGWIATSFATAGEIGRAGIILGAGAGMLGGWQIGKKAGVAVGHAVTLGKLKRPQDNVPSVKTNPTGISRGAAAMVGGTGLIAGAVGGFLEAGALVGAAKIATGLLGGHVAWASVGASALIAGAVGSVAMGAVGAVGGVELFRKGEWCARQTPKLMEWAKKAPQNDILTGAALGAATLVATGALGEIQFPLVGMAASGVVGHAVGFAAGRGLTTPGNRHPLIFAQAMAISGVVCMFSATSVLPLPVNLAARAALGAAGGAFLGNKIRKMREGV